MKSCSPFRGRASARGMSKATEAASTEAPSPTAMTRSRPSPREAASTGRRAKHTIAATFPAGMDVRSRLAQATVTNSATTATETAVLANSGPQNSRAQLGGKVVAPAKHCDGDSSTLEPQYLSGDVGRHPRYGLGGKARRVDVDDACPMMRERPLQQTVGQMRRQLRGHDCELEGPSGRARFVREERRDRCVPVRLDS